ncbi:hypothetical protein HAX54_012562 [Datura stramonium]|uniref:Uncharacterized protein n=1 Tax=Datura stramonium TaxID=4076 RepID=A0ABS8TKV8_DATST|nr:hypothetical protein [Datura stramonium]
MIEVGYGSTVPNKKVDIAKKDDVPVRDTKIIVEKDPAHSDMNKVPKMNVVSSSKELTYVPHYVPKVKRVESPSSGLQHNVSGRLTFPIKQIDAIKSSSKQVEELVKSTNHSPHEALSKRRID